MKIKKQTDLSLMPVKLNTNPGFEYSSSRRGWQGICGIEITKKGRLWVTFYSGHSPGENSQNYVLLISSDNNGNTWSKPKLVIDPPGEVRAFDPCIWHDPQGRLWLFWAQSYKRYDGRLGVWASICNEPDDDNPQWSEPRRIANGIMLNKPTVLTTGEWLLPCAIWDYEQPTLTHLKNMACNDIPEERYSNVYCSEDEGRTFYLRGSADVPGRNFDEHSIIERKDGSLWMIVRKKQARGIGESISLDRGKTWSRGNTVKLEELQSPCSRFFIRRLRSGNIILVNHYKFKKRDHLTAMISKDDGYTWEGHMLLDERDNVAYPDGVQGEDGCIYIVYDRGRKEAKVEKKSVEILMASFTEEDVLEGPCVSDKVRLKHLINKSGVVE